jgi:hypothetical protein
MPNTSGPLTRQQIAAATDDQVLFDLLSGELNRLMLPLPDDLNEQASRIEGLPVGLRAMAATYELDVSMTLDDFGWHFANWHNRRLAELTLAGLRELGASWEAELFEAALFLALQNWSFFAREDFVAAYHGSRVQELLEPLNAQFHELAQAHCRLSSSILEHWVPYARANPDNVCVMPTGPHRS